MPVNSGQGPTLHLSFVGREISMVLPDPEVVAGGEE